MASATDKKMFGHPAGVFLVSGVEMWERFSYYAMTGLFTLFLVSTINNGGFGWDKAQAVKLFGLYSGFIFASPALGGFVSSRFLGERSSILWGGVLIFIGKMALFYALIMPRLMGMEDAFITANLRLGDFLPAEMLNTGFGDNEAAVNAHRLQAVVFMGGLLATIIGTGLLKPAISAIVGMLYPENDPRKESGFGLFMVGVWTGSFLSNFIAGTVGEIYGWHWGFFVAAIGMGGGLGAYLLLAKRYLGNAGLRVKASAKAQTPSEKKVTAQDYRRLSALGVVSMFTIVYAVAFYQKGGLINLLIKNDVNRTIGGFEIPATWFLSITTGAFIIFTPFVMNWFRRREAAGKPLDICQKLAMGLASIGLAYLILTFAMMQQAEGEGASLNMVWFILAYLLFGLGDVFIWPPQIALASALAPRHLASLVIGVWYVTVGVGSYLSGIVGAIAVKTEVQTAFFWLFAALFTAVAVVLLIRPLLLKIMR